MGCTFAPPVRLEVRVKVSEGRRGRVRVRVRVRVRDRVRVRAKVREREWGVHLQASGETTVSTLLACPSASATCLHTSPAIRNSHRSDPPTRKACTCHVRVRAQGA